MKCLSKTIGKLLDFVIRFCTIKTQMINPYSVSFSTPNETSWHRHDNGNVNLVCSYSPNYRKIDFFGEQVPAKDSPKFRYTFLFDHN